MAAVLTNIVENAKIRAEYPRKAKAFRKFVRENLEEAEASTVASQLNDESIRRVFSFVTREYVTAHDSLILSAFSVNQANRCD